MTDLDTIRTHARTIVEGEGATILSARSTDDEASALLDELSDLQTMMVMMMRQGPEWIAAADLVQRTRVLIIERCKRVSTIRKHQAGK